MSEERSKVLEMVADGTITASEGATLLEALGSSRSREKKAKTARKRKIIKTRTMISEIGPMIQATMGDVFKGRKFFESYDIAGMDEVESVSEKLEDHQVLVIHGEAGKGDSISINLSRSEDGTLRASVDNGSNIRSGNKGNKRILQCSSGELTVQVPDNISVVKVFSRGGSIDSSRVAVPAELHTMGGGINISYPGDSFSVKTMGGGMGISLDSSWKGDSKAKTMGGGISVRLSDDVSVLIDANTLGGSVIVGGSNPEIISDSGNGYGKSKVSVKYGNIDTPSRLSVTSMGGGIVLKGESDE
ncbi:MAG: hypothetical protein KAH54_11865 [Candidatus Sabulitectum sp.]|nr:hypothetical protein [Candidatus Sabulitectum sp.]